MAKTADGKVNLSNSEAFGQQVIKGFRKVRPPNKNDLNSLIKKIVQVTLESTEWPNDGHGSGESFQISVRSHPKPRHYVHHKVKPLTENVLNSLIKEIAQATLRVLNAREMAMDQGEVSEFRNQSSKNSITTSIAWLILGIV